MRIAVWVVTASLSLLGWVAPLAARQAADFALQVDRLFEPWSSTTAPGCAVGVSREGQVILARAYGMADLERGARNTPATIFEAGSVSKQVTAAAVVLLALEGKLSLDDPVRKHLPEVPDYGTPLTLRHMLNHTSGLREWGSVVSLGGQARGTRSFTHAHVLDLVSRQRGLNFTPGTEYSYSNTGYILLSEVVARVSGMPFSEFTKRRIFEPLGMRHTSWRDDHRRIVPNRAVAYAIRDGEWILDHPNDDVHGAGAMLTTVEDLLMWTENLETGRLGGPTFIEEMHRQGVLADGTRIVYAAGLQVETVDGERRVGHTGSTAGYRAYLGRYPDHRMAVAVLCNASNMNRAVVGQRVFEAYRGGAAPTPGAIVVQESQDPGTSRPAATGRVPAPPELEAYAGEYHSPDADVTVRVAVEEGGLVLLRRPDTRIPLGSVDTDVFSSSLGTLRFLRDGSGRVVQFAVDQGSVRDLRFDAVR